MHHTYLAYALEPESLKQGASMPQLLKPERAGVRARQLEKPQLPEARAPQLEKAHAAADPALPKINT